MRTLDRREFFAAALSATGAVALPHPVWATLAPTPRQTPGPFYPLSLPLDANADLVTVGGRPAPAQGIVTNVVGRVLQPGGARGSRRAHRDLAMRRVRPLPPSARWRRRRSELSGLRRHRGRSRRLLSLSHHPPGGLPGRTPHVHFALAGPGFERFTTQMYVAGEPRNDGDFVLSRIRDPAARARVIVPLERADALEPGALLGRFDVVVGDA